MERKIKSLRRIRLPCVWPQVGESRSSAAPWWKNLRSSSQGRYKRFINHAIYSIGEGNGNPLQYSCLENPRDGGAWWAAVYGIAQGRTRLKRLSSSSSSKDCPENEKDNFFFLNSTFYSVQYRVNLQYTMEQQLCNYFLFLFAVMDTGCLYCLFLLRNSKAPVRDGSSIQQGKEMERVVHILQQFFSCISERSEELLAIRMPLMG